MPYYSIIVFEMNSSLEVKTLTNVINISQLEDLIKSYNKVVITGTIVKEIYILN